MITPADIRNPKRKSGFNNVMKTHGDAWRPKPYCAQSGRRGSPRTPTEPVGGWCGTARATAEEAALDYCDHINKATMMLTIDDIRNPDRPSGFNYVTLNRGSTSAPKPWVATFQTAASGATERGKRRATPEEAAQDYCDYINGQRGAAFPVALKSHGHTKPERIQRDINPKRAEANALLAEARAEESQDTSGRVYLIGESDDDTYAKIGKSADHPMNRLISMQTGNPRTLVLLGFIETDDCHKLERQLHARFMHLNHKAEWFLLDDSILEAFGIKKEAKAIA